MIRTSVLAAIVLALTAMSAQAGPVKGAAKGVKEVGKGAVQGVGQAGKGIVKGTGIVIKKTGKGVACVVTLGNRCNTGN